MAILNGEDFEQFDLKLKDWRQGDCIVQESWFLYRVSIEQPITRDAKEAVSQQVENAESKVLGFMVTTQTCDIVRKCKERPFIEICPLVKVNESQLKEIQRGRRPSYAYIPGLSSQYLVADLDRTMTVEKPVVAQWKRIPGCNNDEDVRRMNLALARKRARVAFPDDFGSLARKLQKRLTAKHDKNSAEGQALQSLREIRVRAAPSWDAENVDLTFYFIPDDNLNSNNTEWSEYLEQWLKLIPQNGRFQNTFGIVQTLEDMKAIDYVESDLLDLDHLSNRESLKVK